MTALCWSAHETAAVILAVSRRCMKEVSQQGGGSGLGCDDQEIKK